MSGYAANEVVRLQREIASLQREVASLTAERARLRAAIQNYLDGNYPHADKTHKCPHGLYGYEACENCIDEHFQRALAEGTKE